jgi:hypothetical protein
LTLRATGFDSSSGLLHVTRACFIGSEAYACRLGAKVKSVS